MRIWLLLMLVPLGACGTDDDPNLKGRGACESNPEPLEWEQPSALGVSPAEALGRFERPQTCTWTWIDLTEIAEMHPPPGETQAQIAISYHGAGIEYVRGRRLDGDPTIQHSCESSFLVHAELTVSTADGAIDGTSALPITFRTGRRGDGLAEVADEALQDYSLTWIEDWPRGPGYAVQVTSEPSGELHGTFGELTPEGSWFGMAPTATWSCAAVE